MAGLEFGRFGILAKAGRFVPAGTSQFVNAASTGAASGPSNRTVAFHSSVEAPAEPEADVANAQKASLTEKTSPVPDGMLMPQQGSPRGGIAAGAGSPATQVTPGNGEVVPAARPPAAVPAVTGAISPAFPPAASGSLANDPHAFQISRAASGSTAASNEGLLTRAEQGDPGAQFELAGRYAGDASTKGNLALAAHWYEKAANQGHAVAQYRLGSMYEKGRGVTKNAERAKDLYQRAAEQGNVRAMHNLGVMAAEGGDGKPNYTSAALWFSKAAEYGIKDSQFNFAVLLARGLGVTKDLVRSYTWFVIVAAAGDAEAAVKRDEIAASLTRTELAAANSAAASYAPQPPNPEANEPLPQNPGESAARQDTRAKL